MLLRTKVIILTLAGIVIGFLLQPSAPIGSMIWPPAPGPAPTGAQLSLLIVMGLIESTALGLGLAFLVVGWPILRDAPGVSRGLAMATYLSIGFGLVSWVPHIALHISNGADFWGLIRIDYAFHLPLIVAASVTAVFFYRVLTASQARPLAH